MVLKFRVLLLTTVIESWNIEFTSYGEKSDVVSLLNDVLFTRKSFIIIYNVVNYLTPTWFFIVLTPFLILRGT